MRKMRQIREGHELRDMLQIARVDVSGKRTIERRGSKATMSKAVLERVMVVLGMRDRVGVSREETGYRIRFLAKVAPECIDDGTVAGRNVGGPVTNEVT
jgi:hypothetical protein